MKKLIKVFCTFAAAVLFFWYENKSIVSTVYKIYSAKLPYYFDGLKIVQISDLQGAVFGKNNVRLIKKIEAAKPDIIVLTGDIVYSRNVNVKKAYDFANEISKICTAYFVCGNHDCKSGRYEEIKKRLEKTGIVVLDNRAENIDKEGKMQIVGVVDPEYGENADVEKNLNTLLKNKKDCFNVVLCHRPEIFESYVKAGADLVFCGHAHGGQVRLPFIGGLFAPHQGFLPQYTSGVHRKNKTQMVVNRGLGNSRFPLRIFNRPEIVVAVIKKCR